MPRDGSEGLEVNRVNIKNNKNGAQGGHGNGQGSLVERGIMIHQLLALLLQVHHLSLQVLRLPFVAIPQGAELLMPLLLRADGGVQAADFILNGQFRLRELDIGWLNQLYSYEYIHIYNFVL